MAGFDFVCGVDIQPQPRYCGNEFVKADAIEYLELLIKSGEINKFDVIHASPPCLAYSISRNNGCHANAPMMIDDVRRLLTKSQKIYVIENVETAPMLDMPLFESNVITLCGASFGLGLDGFDLPRHRLFESNIALRPLLCAHSKGRTIGVYGNGTNSWHRKKFGRCITVAELRTAMKIEWMTRKELTQAIPPPYTEFIGRQLLSMGCYPKSR